MSTSQRVSRGFHRLAIFLGAIPLIVGGTYSLFLATDVADRAKANYEEQVKLACARTALKGNPIRSGFIPDDEKIDLEKLGCSDKAKEVSAGSVYSATAPANFSYAAHFLPTLGVDFAITLAAAFAIYGLIRAIGWVISGFAAS